MPIKQNKQGSAAFTIKNRCGRVVWACVYWSLFRYTPVPMHAWRAWVLRMCGAKVGRGVRIYPGVRIWAPWNLDIGNYVGVASGATLYSMDEVVLGDYSVVSQGAYLCAGTHDYNIPSFQLVTKPVVVMTNAWIGARAFVMPGVVVPEGTVIGAMALVQGAGLEPWTVYAGNPAKKIKNRVRLEAHE